MDPDGLLFSLRTGLGDTIADIGIVPFLLGAVGVAAFGSILLGLSIALTQWRAVRRAARPAWDDEASVTGPVPQVERLAMAFPSTDSLPRIGFHAAQPLIEAGRPSYPRITAPRPASFVKAAEPGCTAPVPLLAHRMARLVDRYLGETVEVKTRVRLAGPTGMPYFEPDLVVVHRNARLRLHLAIEIDVPYDAEGLPRNTCDAQGPPHALRDRQMAARGWVIVRFAEEQVVRDPGGCCRYIAEVLRALTPSWTLPPEIEAVPMLEALACWSEAEARAWAAAARRERYLGLPHLPETVAPLPDLVREQSAEAEAIEAALAEAYPDLVVERPTPQTLRALPAPQASHPIIEQPISIEALQGDGASGGWPQVDRAESPSLGSLDDRLGRFFPSPDLDAQAEAIASSRVTMDDPKHPCFGMRTEEIAQRLKQAHERAEAAERAIRSGRPSVVEGRQMRDFFRTHPTLRIERTRWRVDNGTVHATVDVLCRRPDGVAVLIRWVRARTLHLEARERAASPFDHLANTAVWRVAVEVSWLRHVLAKRYDLEIAEAYLVTLHPDRPRAEPLALPHLKREALLLDDALTHGDEAERATVQAEVVWA